MNKKSQAGFKIAAEIIITIVLAMAFLTLSLYFIKTKVIPTQEFASDIFLSKMSETKREMLELEMEKKGHALSKTKFELKPGDEETFLIGIKNRDNEKEFTLFIDSTWFEYKKQPTVIPTGEHTFLPIIIKIPAESERGTYFFEINIQSENQTISSELLEVSIENV